MSASSSGAPNPSVYMSSYKTWISSFVVLALGASRASADDTPGYAEQVVQWRVQAGETCEDVAQALYGNPSLKRLVLRYNKVACVAGAPLTEGTVLVMPATPTEVAPAKLVAVRPDTQAKPPGGSWAPAASGQDLQTSSSVNTRTDGRAGILFADRSRIFLAENTLVVVYGTASDSAVSATEAPVVLKSGELKAGLAALSGKPLAIRTDDGGRVETESTDTVVSAGDAATIVSVFDGLVRVMNAGSSVEVKKNYGTKYEPKKPPMKPRPLPPAPLWVSQPPSFVFGEGLRAEWQAVPRAKAYRVEVATDAAFDDILVREHVGADVHALKLESLPAGSYFVRVRAIDDEDFLGIATDVVAVHFVGLAASRGRAALEKDALTVNPFSVVALTAPDTIEVAADDGPFGPAPTALDLGRQPPKILHFRRKGDTTAGRDLVVLQEPVAYASTATLSADTVDVSVELPEADNLTLEEVGLSAVWRDSRGDVAIALDATSKTKAQGSLRVGALFSDATLIVTDRRGREVLRKVFSNAPPSLLRADAAPLGPLGAEGLLVSAPRAAGYWWAPGQRGAAALGVAVEGAPDAPMVMIVATGRGSLGDFGANATVRSPALGSQRARVADARIGVDYRLRGRDSGDTAVGIGLAFNLPLEQASTEPSFEPSLAFGSDYGVFGWLCDFGLRVRLDLADSPSDAVTVVSTAGVTLDLAPWARAYLLLDAAIDNARVHAGAGAGVELGTWIFGSIGARVTPLPDAYSGWVGAHASIGMRAF
ncbi:MAG: FecR family protein [Polyangiaceae bacterium]